MQVNGVSPQKACLANATLAPQTTKTPLPVRMVGRGFVARCPLLFENDVASI